MKFALVAISISLCSTLWLTTGGSFAVAAPAVNPATEEYQPIILPTSPWYAVKEWWRELRVRLTTDPLARVDQEQLQLRHRLIDVQALFGQPIDADTANAIDKSLARYRQHEQRLQTQLTELRQQTQDQAVVQALLQQTATSELSRQSQLEQLAQAAPDAATQTQAALAQTITQSFDQLAATTALVTGDTNGTAVLLIAAQQGNWLERLHRADILQRLTASASPERVALVRSAARAALEAAATGIEALPIPEQTTVLSQFVNQQPTAATLETILERPALGRQLERVERQSATEALDSVGQLFQ